jgi:predicted metal-dependent peptidase
MSEDVAYCSKTNARITNEEWFEISRALEPHHAVFYKVWEMGKPVFDDSIPTACVQFDNEGKFIWFRFNPGFWSTLDLYNKLFVICHEAMHVVLNHGARSRDAGVNSAAANVAMDIVVNHTLVRSFGFERDKIDNSENYCWIDTVFKDRLQKPSEDETFEHYFNMLDAISIDLVGPGMPKTVDGHEGLGDGDSNWGKVIKELNGSLSEEEKKAIESTIKKHFQDEERKKDGDNSKDGKDGGTHAGSGTGGWCFVTTGTRKRKKKWETIIKKWAIRHLKTTDKEVEQWIKINRRMSMLPRDMMLPTDAEVEVEDREATKIKVWFFLDTSGSCWNLKDRFFMAAESLPEYRFQVRLFCFDTMVQETTLESKKVYGGGGTSFKIIEDHVSKTMQREKIKHPDAVFVITDGYGDNIRPSKPEKWHWFLTADGSKGCIDPGCNIYSLAEFE